MFWLLLFTAVAVIWGAAVAVLALIDGDISTDVRGADRLTAETQAKAEERGIAFPMDGNPST